MDITYIPMARGFVYLAAVIDWHSRKVLAWRLSISMDTAFCVQAVEEAIARYGKPEIFNTDQGSQFTSSEFTGLLHRHGILRLVDLELEKVIQRCSQNDDGPELPDLVPRRSDCRPKDIGAKLEFQCDG